MAAFAIMADESLSQAATAMTATATLWHPPIYEIKFRIASPAIGVLIIAIRVLRIVT